MNSISPAPSPINVMVVEDDEDEVVLLLRFLEEMDHQVVYFAETGNDAVDNYNSFFPDLVTVDVGIPHLDGLAVTKKILEQHPDARILMITGNGESAVVKEAMKSGAKGYLLKPFNKKALKEAVERTLGQ